MILSPLLKQGHCLKRHTYLESGLQVAMETDSSEEPSEVYDNHLSSASSSSEEHQELEQSSVKCTENIQIESSFFDPAVFPFQDISTTELTEMQSSCESFLETNYPQKKFEIDCSYKDEKTSSMNKMEVDQTEDSDDLGFHLFDIHEFESKSSNLPLHNTSHDNHVTKTDIFWKPKVEQNIVNTNDKQQVSEIADQNADTQIEMVDRISIMAQPNTTDALVEEDFCCICRCEHTNPVVLSKCSHKYCRDCIDAYFEIKPVCPECFVPYGIITGNQPEGHMEHNVNSRVRLQGQDKPGAIVICYSFDNGTQTKEHPKPGKPYYGTSRTAYLPDTPEGRKVLKLLQEGFKRRLIFTIGMSRTTGADDVVTWNDIHHKTCTSGGFENFGYPDSTYLQRVQEELAAVGVTEDSLTANQDSAAKKPYIIL